MRDTIARITDCIADLNGVINDISDNDTLEFDLDNRLRVLETGIDDLSSDVNSTVEDSSDMSES